MKQIQILLCLLAICFAACNSDDTPTPEPPVPGGKSERTILVYMAAHNNLSSYSDQDIYEMKEGSKSLKDNQNLMIFVDDKSSTEKSYFIHFKD